MDREKRRQEIINAWIEDQERYLVPIEHLLNGLLRARDEFRSRCRAFNRPGNPDKDNIPCLDLDMGTRWTQVLQAWEKQKSRS